MNLAKRRASHGKFCDVFNRLAESLMPGEKAGLWSVEKFGEALHSLAELIHGRFRRLDRRRDRRLDQSGFSGTTSHASSIRRGDKSHSSEASIP
jgi:hypothetical protein